MDDPSLGSGSEGITALSEDLHEIVGEVAARQVEAEDGVGERVTLVDRDSVGDIISNVEDDTSGAARRVEREDGLDGDADGGDELGVEGASVKDGVLLGGNGELVVEGVVPDLHGQCLGITK